MRILRSDQLTTRQTARLFLVTRGRGGENEKDDLEALTKLIDLILEDNIKHIKEYYLLKHPETKNLDHGDLCGCFLCYLDQTD